MPPRNPELPEGTDHIITGAMETGAGADASTGSSGGAGAPGGDTGFMASGGAAGGLGSGTGGLATGASTGASGGTSGSTGLSAGGTSGTSGGSSGGGSGSSGGGSSSSGGGAAEKLAAQVRNQVYSLRDQATEKAREYADTGKGQVTSTLNNITDIVNEAARAVDQRLGEQYGQYAHRAADAVSSFAQTLDGKSLEDLVDDTRSAVRKSPAIAVGTAALLGFVLMRVVRAGMPTNDGTSGGASSGQGRTSETGTGGTANRTGA